LTANPTANPATAGDAVTFTYQWLEDGQTLTGQTNQTLILSGLTFKEGDYFTVQITPTENGVTGAMFTTSPLAITGTSPITTAFPAPIVTAIGITTDSPVTTLTANPFVTQVNPSDTVTYTYQWFEDGQPLMGQMGPTLSLAGLTFTTGDYFNVEVTPTENGVTGATVASGPLAITGTSPITTAFPAPIITAATVTSDDPTDASILTANPTVMQVNPADTVTYTYQWQYDGGTVIGQTGNTLSLAGFTLTTSDFFNAIITPTENGVTGAPFTSSTLTITGTTPFITTT
jgi:predicted RecA/RadA family phage recombinase